MTNDLILLISEDYIKEYSPIQYNSDFQKIQMSIIDSQRLHLEPSLGTDLFNKILDLVDSDTISGTTYDTLLTKYIQPMLFNGTMLLALPYLHFEFGNKSINTLNSTNSTSGTIPDLNYLTTYFQNTFDTYRTRLRDHLISNSTLYPEYSQHTNNENLYPNQADYTSSIQF